jgi:cation-transporting ATPase E
LTTSAIVIGAIGIALVEAAWWISAALRGEKRTLFGAISG